MYSHLSLAFIKIQLIRHPNFLVRIYINFDGDMKSTAHSFEKIVDFLCRHSQPDTTLQGPASCHVHHALCLDSLVLMIQHMTINGISVL